VACYILRYVTCPQTITHLNTNQARHRATLLIRHNALLLRQLIITCHGNMLACLLLCCVYFHFEFATFVVQSVNQSKHICTSWGYHDIRRSCGASANSVWHRNVERII